MGGLTVGTNFLAGIDLDGDSTAAQLGLNLIRNGGVVRANRKADAEMAIATHNKATRIAHQNTYAMGRRIINNSG
jgi:hypothetical protein